MTSCDGGGTGNGTSSVIGNNTQSTNAPASVAGKTLKQTVSSGSAPFANSGSFFLDLGGDPGSTSGHFTLLRETGFVDSDGSYTYSQTGPNTGTIMFNDTTHNLTETEQLTYQTPASGTFRKTGPSGAFQQGTFTSD